MTANSSRLPKLCGTDVEVGNFILGVDRAIGSGAEASRALLREIEGFPRAREIESHTPGWAVWKPGWRGGWEAPGAGHALAIAPHYSPRVVSGTTARTGVASSWRTDRAHTSTWIIWSWRPLRR